MMETCPKCGGTAVLLQTTEEVQEMHDLDKPKEKTVIPIKVEEYRCQDPNCEHEFEKVIKEPTT